MIVRCGKLMTQSLGVLCCSSFAVFHHVICHRGCWWFVVDLFPSMDFHGSCCHPYVWLFGRMRTCIDSKQCWSMSKPSTQPSTHPSIHSSINPPIHPFIHSTRRRSHSEQCWSMGKPSAQPPVLLWRSSHLHVWWPL